MSPNQRLRKATKRAIAQRTLSPCHVGNGAWAYEPEVRGDRRGPAMLLLPRYYLIITHVGCRIG
jgi:hypothetical protein